MTGALQHSQPPSSHFLLPPPPKVGRDSRLAGGGDLDPAGPWGPCLSLPEPCFRALEDKGYTGCGSPSVPHQSRLSRLHPLPDVQECEARGCPEWGEGERCLSAAGPGAFFRPYYPQRHPHPPLARRKGGPEGPAPPPQPSLGAARGAAEERAPAGLGGELLAGGPADFLLISSRKPAPCASLRTALGCGESGGSAPPARPEGGGGGDPGRGDAWLPEPVPALRWALDL